MTNRKQFDIIAKERLRGYGSVGRAMRSQRIGQGFESPYLHHKQRKSNRLVRLFRICGGAEGGAARADRDRDRLHARADISDKDNACRPCMLVVRQVLSSAPKKQIEP